jgi:hypothetical protein
MMRDGLRRFATVLILSPVTGDLLPCPTTTIFYGF